MKLIRSGLAFPSSLVLGVLLGCSGSGGGASPEAPRPLPSLLLSTPQPGAQDKLTLTVLNGHQPPHAMDWIGLYAEGVAPGTTPTLWRRTLTEAGLTAASGTIVFDPAQAAPGKYVGGKSYRFVLAFDDSTTVAASASFTTRPDPLPTTQTVHLAGNAFITQGMPDATEVITSKGLADWTSPATVTSVYFWASQPGDLKLGLVSTLAGSATSTVKLSALGKSFSITLAGTTSKAYDAGTITVDKPGYVKVDLQGVSKDGDYFGDPTGLQVTGLAANGLVFADKAADFYWSRRGPSVHMGYETPAETEYFYNEVTVPIGQDAIGTYAMTNGFGEGYCGIQVNSETERRILFSVWDPETSGKTTLIKKGPEVVDNTFGGEGTGGQSYLIFPWKAGTTYRLLTRAMPDGAGATLYSAWFFAPEQGVWRFLATWKRPGISTYLKRCHSFLENFLDENGHLGRTAYYGNQWSLSRGGTWTEATSGYFTGDATATNRQRMDFAGGAVGDLFFLRNGGFFSAMVPTNQTFTRVPTGRKPDVDVTKLP